MKTFLRTLTNILQNYKAGVKHKISAAFHFAYRMGRSNGFWTTHCKSFK